jgi:hypothetical protein
MHIEFQNFVFPLAAHIDYRVVSADVTERRARYKTTMGLVQNGMQCASATIDFTVYPAEVIARKEAELSGLVTESMLAARRVPPAGVPAAADIVDITLAHAGVDIERRA